MPDAKEQQLQRELGECVMGSSWIFCVLGLGLAIPIGIKTKASKWLCLHCLCHHHCTTNAIHPAPQSYNPVVYLGLSGTLLDLLMVDMGEGCCTSVISSH